MSPVLRTALPPISHADLARVKHLRDVERRPWAFIASDLGRREQTLRDHYERATDVRTAAAHKMLKAASLDFLTEDRLIAAGDALAPYLRPEHRAKADSLALTVWKAMSGVKPAKPDSSSNRRPVGTRAELLADEL